MVSTIRREAVSSGATAPSKATGQAALTGPLTYDSDLIQRARGREPAAWSALYDHHYGALFRYAYTRLGSPEEAEDLAAQVFLEAYKGIDAFEDRGRPILAWLYRIAHNLIIERIRRDEVARRYSAGALPPAYHAGPEHALDSLDLRAALDQLTAEQQEVITLRYLLQLTSREAAEVMGKSRPAVTSLQVRALASLKRIMRPRHRRSLPA
jgi:RNA polymerase sigma-70 factor (ECF subfamily)